MRRSAGIPVLVTLSVGAALADPPDGFEIIDIVADRLSWIDVPYLNNCAQVVFSPMPEPRNESHEIFLYDNGYLTQMTRNEVPDNFPDINDEGAMTWTVGDQGQFGGKVVILTQGEIIVLGEGRTSRINNVGHVAWVRYNGQGCSEADADIFFFDGQSVRQLTDDSTTKGGPVINDGDDITWARADLCKNPYVRAVMLYSEGRIIKLPNLYASASLAHINNPRQVAFGGSSAGVELWEGGVNRLITDWGSHPRINDAGEIFFLRFFDDNRTWQGHLYRPDGEILQLTDDPFWNTDGDINNWGEIVWRAVNVRTSERRVRLMRRVRTGDSEFDSDIDLIDYAQFAACMTGPEWVKRKNPGPHDSLCDCRFLDINHDGDVDLADFALFQNAFTGE